MGEKNTVGSDPDSILGSVSIDDIAALDDESIDRTQPVAPMVAGFERAFSDLSAALEVEQRPPTPKSDTSTSTTRKPPLSTPGPIGLTDRDAGLLECLEAGAVDLDTVSPERAIDADSLDQAASELLASLDDQ